MCCLPGTEKKNLPQFSKFTSSHLFLLSNIATNNAEMNVIAMDYENLKKKLKSLEDQVSSHIFFFPQMKTGTGKNN